MAAEYQGAFVSHTEVSASRRPTYRYRDGLLKVVLIV